MKSANAMFATRLSRPESKSDEMQMDGVVEFKGAYYTIYGSALHAVNNHIKSESEEYYILSLASLGEEFMARGIQSGSNKIHVRLGCGLPQKWYEKQKDSFKGMLWKNNELQFSYSGNTYNVCLENVTVYMQGFAALPVLECIIDKAGHVVLVDIGGETVDVIVCEKFHPMFDKCRIDTRATIALLKDIVSELQSELGETIPQQDIIKYIGTGGKDKAPANDYESIIQRCLCKYAEYIFTRLKEWGINTGYTNICFIGGGGRIVKFFGTYSENIHFCDDMKVNAKEYEFFESALAKNQR
jgi:plasmid segregation protein ParM